MKLKLLITVVIAFAIFTLALFVGPKLINPFRINEMEKEILISIRLPRIIVSILMGMALGASGAVLQGILRNPLADPYILGISSGAGVGAVIRIQPGRASVAAAAAMPLAFIGALITGV